MIILSAFIIELVGHVLLLITFGICKYIIRLYNRIILSCLLLTNLILCEYIDRLYNRIGRARSVAHELGYV